MRDFSKLKICFLAGTLEHGGAERQLFYLLQALCQRGAAPRVLCFDRGEIWEERIRSLGVPVTWVGQRQSRLVRLAEVIRELRNDPPDVFQGQHFFANAYVCLASFLLGIHGIGAMRNEATAEVLKNGAIGGWINLHLPKVIAANTRVAIAQAISRGIPRSRLYFLPNAIDVRCFQPAGRQTGRPVTLVAVGRLVREKRFDRFISALGRLRAESNAEVRGWIVGPAQDTHLKAELEGQAFKLGLVPGRLEFLGDVSNMAPIYQQADVCVLTSDYEGTPNVLLEAMASALPVVAANVGGVPEIVQHAQTGLLFKPQDQQSLSTALLELVRNVERRREMGSRAREYVEMHHSLEGLPAYLDELYSLALGSRGVSGAVVPVKRRRFEPPVTV